MSSTIATLFQTTLNFLTGYLKVQEDAARQFTALGFPAYTTEDGRPRFAMIKNSDLLVETLAKFKAVAWRSFEAAGYDFDNCIQSLGSVDEYGYANASMRRRLFAAVYEAELTSKDDLDHICHTDDCKDVEACSHRMCLNPFHMAVTSRTENVKRSMGNRHNSGMATHCKRGHEYTVENTRINKVTGARKCISCEDDRREAIRNGTHVPKKLSATHCNNGHDRSVHTVVGKNGYKFCGKCKSDLVLKKYHEKKAIHKSR